MENTNLIESVLVSKNITHYKIIRHVKKQLWYKDSFNNITYDDVLLKKIFVVFKFKNKVGKFTTFDTDNSSKIKKIIDKCLENSQINSYYFSDVYDENPNPDYFKNDIAKEYFENFDISKIVEFLKKNLTNVENTINLTINSSYKISVSKYELLTNDFYREQFVLQSEMLCMDNVLFQRQACIKNLFLDAKFSKQIINELSEEGLHFSTKNINVENIKFLLFEKPAVAEIINNYIVGFYANNVYHNLPHVIKNIGKKIYKKNFCIVSLPFENIFFDSEGMPTKEKPIITNGILENLLGNVTYSKYLNISSFGNADLENSNLIRHQRLKFSCNDIFDKRLNNRDYVKISELRNVIFDFKEEKFGALAKVQAADESFFTTINFSFSEFFDNIYSCGDIQREWTNNVYCDDILLRKNNI